MNTKRSRFRRAAAALSMGALCLAGAGCDFGAREGRGARGHVPLGPSPFGLSPAIAGVGTIYDIYSIIPDQGPLAGGNRAQLQGRFPNPQNPTELAEAMAAYTVYLGNNIANYDSSSPPELTSSIINVIVPPGDALGLVDVIFRENLTQLDAATLYYGYEYLDPFAITGVAPDRGPMAGGQQVTVFGRFPIAAPMSTIAEAYGAYRVYFDGRPAGFDASFNPVITAETMYVLTPPGVAPNAPGLVDVSVATMVYSPDTPEFRVLPLGYEYIGELELTDVTPNRGFIFGDEPVTLEGVFPVSNAFSSALLANQARLYYTAYFGYRIAPFDLSVPTPVITPTQMLVRSPPADAVGFVDVRVEETPDPSISSTLARAYRYYALYITDIVPDFGPLAGGNQVKIFGLIPAFDSIYSIYEAEQYYTVFFDGIQAPFADMTPDPVILPSQIDTINRTYTTGYMYVIAPPGAVPGFVDVRIQDDLDIDLDAVAPDGYEYIAGDDISRWDTAVVVPNPVGKLEAGELLVTITGIGSLGNSASSREDRVFIIPQGGEPDQSGDRIELEEVDNVESGSDFTWTGTNRVAIPRILSNGLLVDGHAAIYISLDGGGIIGDDPSDPTDGGIIQPLAQDGRHFLIDTVPPRLQLIPAIGGRLRGDDFVAADQTGNWTIVSDLDSGTPPANQNFPHPYVPPVGVSNANDDAPFDGNVMTRGTDPDSRAQVFFKVSSLTNNFADSLPDANGLPEANLQFELAVIFEDVDVYTARGMTPAEVTAGRNADFFGGDTRRQVAGFADGLSVTRTGLRDDMLVNGNEVLIQWDFQSTPFQLPEITGIDVEYSSGPPAADGANPVNSPNLFAAPTLLFGTFFIGDSLDPATGVQLDDVGVRSLMSVILRAVDRAGDYSPRLQETPGTKKLYTRNDTSPLGYHPNVQPEMGPLNLWWLRSTGTRLLSNIPASGDTRTPAFTWENIGQPDPRAVVVGTEGTERLFSYGIYQTDPTSGTRDEQRDGPYTLLGSRIADGGGLGVWSEWVTDTELTATQVAEVTGAIEGAWLLIAVMSVDEAGNLELWPEDQLQISAGGGPATINFVNESGGAEERNWDRWFVPPLAESVDTRIEPVFWHDDTNDDPLSTLNIPEMRGRPDANEINFGDAEVIPLPPPVTFSPLSDVLDERVTGQFRVSLISDEPTLWMEWELLRDGVSLGVFLPPPDTDSIIGNVISIVIPDPGNTDPTDPNAYLGAASREPTYYIFRARAFSFEDANANGDFDLGETVLSVDASPATVQFVVVDNVANHIQTRKSEDAQPIQEIDRP